MYVCTVRLRGVVGGEKNVLDSSQGSALGLVRLCLSVRAGRLFAEDCSDTGKVAGIPFIP